MTEINTEHTELTKDQKLHALGHKYYSFAKWEPAIGDYYTTSRPDFELYQIMDIDECQIWTCYCTNRENLTSWPIDVFLKEFGLCRVHVPMWVLEKVK